MTKKLYLLTAEGGYSNKYGNIVYLLGIFDDRNIALAKQSQLNSKEIYPIITEVNLNEYYQLSYDKATDGYYNDYCLGGYAE